MSVPVLMPGAALLFWGWQAGVLPIAVPMALALEARHVYGGRWTIATPVFQRIADLTTWSFVLLAAWITFSKGLPVPILAILVWLPVVLLPLVAAQLYSSAGTIELSALFLSLRGEAAGRLARSRVDLAPAYVVICVLAAGAANYRTAGYYAGVATFALWGLWSIRSRRCPAALWVVLAAVAVTTGYAGHVGLSRLQTWVFNLAVEYFQLDASRTDPYRSYTDIGQIGELKLSDRIVLRVDLPPGTPPPLLLHRASYNVYASTTWVARDASFAPIESGSGPGAWPVAPAAGADAPESLPVIRVRETLPTGRGVLSLPRGTVRIEGLAAIGLARNRMGAVQVERAPGAVGYRARYAPGPGGVDPPTEHDLRVPLQERAAVDAVAAELGLAGIASGDALDRIRTYFARGFRYSTWRADRSSEPSAIGEFLATSRAGHCEYFASATVLVARAACIPARYATGFSVQEWSDIERAWVVRERHAHAWARVYVDGAWHDLDTTPSQWFVEEARSARPWEGLFDLGSWIAFSLAAWRAADSGGEMPPWAYGALALLFAALVWRVFRGGGLVRTRQGRAGRAVHDGAGGAFARIEGRLAGLGLARAPHQTLTEWLAGIGRTRPGIDVRSLDPLVRLHYRTRFDPPGLAPDERDALEQGVERWLAAHAGLR